MRILCFNIAVDSVSRAEAIGIFRKFLTDGKQHYIVTPNPEMAVLAAADVHFRKAIRGADLALPDGVGLVMALRLFGFTVKERISGTDFLNLILENAPTGTSFFFLGGENNVSLKAAEYAKEKYGTVIAGTNEPRRGVYRYAKKMIVADREAHRLLIRLINQCKPDILIAALGHGQQEKWLANYLTNCPGVKIGIGVGGALDYLAQRAVRPPMLIRLIGLEWLWRLVHEPRRWRRIIRATVIFPINTVRWLLSMTFKYRPLAVGCILNQRNKILLVLRADMPNHWQFPQGGGEPGESLAQAVFREMAEEVGLKKLRLIGQSKSNVYKYRWRKEGIGSEPKENQRRRYYGYAGQQATVFYLRHSGVDDDIKVDQVEIVSFKWVPLDQLLTAVHPVRRPLAKIILKDLQRLAVNGPASL